MKPLRRTCSMSACSNSSSPSKSKTKDTNKKGSKWISCLWRQRLLCLGPISRFVSRQTTDMKISLSPPSLQHLHDRLFLPVLCAHQTWQPKQPLSLFTGLLLKKEIAVDSRGGIAFPRSERLAHPSADTSEIKKKLCRSGRQKGVCVILTRRKREKKKRDGRKDGWSVGYIQPDTSTKENINHQPPSSTKGTGTE